MLFLQSVIDLFYPVLCLHCENKLVQTEKLICTFCMLSIPKTNFHNDPSNPMIRSLQGRFPVEYACAYMNFNKGGIAQSVLHHLKYKGNANVGAVFGEYFAKEICNHPFIKKADYLIPVPLHKKKLKKRGYNQSLLICNGMQNILQVSVIEALMRISDKETQTHKKRFERWKNVNALLKPISRL